MRCHSFSIGVEHSSKVSVGVVFASSWPIGQLLAAPGSTGASPKGQSTDAWAAGITSVEQDGGDPYAAKCGPDEEEEGD